jgi:hypothetical protein
MTGTDREHEGIRTENLRRDLKPGIAGLIVIASRLRGRLIAKRRATNSAANRILSRGQ